MVFIDAQDRLLVLLTGIAVLLPSNGCENVQCEYEYGLFAMLTDEARPLKRYNNEHAVKPVL
jgi:hypothetical protein